MLDLSPATQPAPVILEQCVEFAARATNPTLGSDIRAGAATDLAVLMHENGGRIRETASPDFAALAAASDRLANAILENRLTQGDAIDALGAFAFSKNGTDWSVAACGARGKGSSMIAAIESWLSDALRILQGAAIEGAAGQGA